MAVREILRMGDPRLLQVADTVTDFGSSALRGLIDDMFDTMRATGGVGLAAPQIGVSLQVVIFGFERSERYPEAPPVPLTVLINPQIVPLGDAEVAGWEGCLSVPGFVARYGVRITFAIPVSIRMAWPSSARCPVFMRVWFSMSATT